MDRDGDIVHKRKQQYEMEKNMEYGGIEHMRVDPKARAKFKAKAYEPIQLPRYNVTEHMKTKEHSVEGVLQCGECERTE